MPVLQVHLPGPMDTRHGDQQPCEPPTLTLDDTNQSAQSNSKVGQYGQKSHENPVLPGVQRTKAWAIGRTLGPAFPAA